MPKVKVTATKVKEFPYTKKGKEAAMTMKKKVMKKKMK